MKQITDLRIQRANYISEMETLVNSAKEGQRDLSEVENARWSQLDADIKKIDNSIAMLERQDELNKSIVTVAKPTIVTPSEYSVARAIKGLYNNKLSGVELERHQELSKNAGDVWDGRGIFIPMSAFEKRAVLAHADNTLWEPTAVNNTLSIIKTKQFIQELGITVFSNLNGNLRLPSMNSLTASFVEEKSDMSEFTVTQAVETLSPRRVGAYKDLSAEFFASNSPELINATIVEMVDSIYRTVFADVLDNIDRQITPMTSRASGDTAEFVSADLLTAMEGDLNIDGLGQLKYLVHPKVRAYAKKTAFLANQGPIWVGQDMNGYTSYASSLVNNYSGSTKYQTILADWSKAVIGEFSGIQVLIDPYTQGLKSYTRVHVSLLVDTGIWNKGGFVLAQNVKVA